ncbi:MAG: hypothetical protein ACRC50_00240, partial [Gaiella sp.]
MGQRVSGLTRGTLASAPSVCHDCVWWQSRGNKTASKERWTERVEEEWGEWGTIYLDDDGRFLGVMQYGHSGLFPRAADLPAGPPSEDAVLVTCAYVARSAGEWVEKSLLLAAIGESRDQGASAVEAFAYRYAPDADERQRFHVHRTVFPRDFLDEFGFTTLRTRGGSSSAGSSSAASRRSRRDAERACSGSSRRPSRRRCLRRCRGRETRARPGWPSCRRSRLQALRGVARRHRAGARASARPSRASCRPPASGDVRP